MIINQKIKAYIKIQYAYSTTKTSGLTKVATKGHVQAVWRVVTWVICLAINVNVIFWCTFNYILYLLVLVFCIYLYFYSLCIYIHCVFIFVFNI